MRPTLIATSYQADPPQYVCYYPPELLVMSGILIGMFFGGVLGLLIRGERVAERPKPPRRD